MNKYEGKILAIWKPVGPTSHDIINILRRKTNLKKIGHAGTLDPLAEGVLVIGFGREATKKLSQIILKDKEYQAEITLGFTSETYDAEGPLKKTEIIEIPTLEKIEGIIDKFIGLIEQIPPAYSALKIKGRKAYQLKRSGENIVMKPRKISIEKIDIVNYSFPLLTLQISCGSGTYIRSLANDLGQELKIGGYLSNLIRLRVGQFTAEQSLNIDEI